MADKVHKSDEEWKKELGAERYAVMRKAATERAFTGEYNLHFEDGVYRCAGCGTALFASETKYDHGTGWPSFTSPIDEKNIEYRKDNSFFMSRIEVRCAVCGSHLGHVFDDGPGPSGKHYCINSVCLGFQKKGTEPEMKIDGQVSSSSNSGAAAPAAPRTETAIFAAGCFWGVEHKLRQVNGVLETKVGYTGGRTKDPTYAQVCSDKTGHAEAVRVIFDPIRVGYEDLLKVFFSIHDPTQLNRQGPDVGTQYRTAIFYADGHQKAAAQNMLKELHASGRYLKNIVTEIVPATEFYEAEDYHQRYYEKLGRR